MKKGPDFGRGRTSLLVTRRVAVNSLTAKNIWKEKVFGSWYLLLIRLSVLYIF